MTKPERRNAVADNLHRMMAAEVQHYAVPWDDGHPASPKPPRDLPWDEWLVIAAIVLLVVFAFAWNRHWIF